MSNRCVNCGENIPKYKKFCNMECMIDNGNIEVQCEQCGKIEKIWKTRANKYKTCSKECMGLRSRRKHNAECYICGNTGRVKPSRLNKIKTNWTCSKECSLKYRSMLMNGDGNHQYGLKGSLNSSFSGGKRVHCGYYWIYMPDHPMSINTGYVREHRYNASLYIKEPEDAFEVINGIRCIKQSYEVHHIDEDRLNNDPINLKVLTKSEHMRLHGEIRKERKQNV